MRKITSLKEKFPSVSEVTKKFFNRTNHQMNKEQVGLLKKSLDFRKKTLDDNKWGGNIFSDNELLGIYLVAKNVGFKKEVYFIVAISNHPNHILTRTTGRPGYSCEQISEPYWKGPFQDVAYKNPTIYFFLPNKKFPKWKNLNLERLARYIKDKDELDGFEWKARLNTRWCITNEGKVDAGIDPNIYPMQGKKPSIYNDFMVAAWYIYQSYGFLNYIVAETPYVYVGHSDSTRGGGIYHLPFIGIKYRVNWAAPEETCYDLMRTLDIKSRNKKAISRPPQEEVQFIETDVDEHEEEIVDKIAVRQRLTQMEITTLREMLVINYRYDEDVVEEMDDDEVQEEFLKIYSL